MEIHKRKLYKTIGITTIILFFLGSFFVSALLIYVTESSLGHVAIFLAPFDILKFKLSIGLLLVLCLPVALFLSWAYSRKRSSSLTLTTFFISLLTAVVSSFLGLWLRLMEMKGILESAISMVPDAKISILAINYFKWGISSMLIVCLPIVFVLYKQKKT